MYSLSNYIRPNRSGAKVLNWEFFSATALDKIWESLLHEDSVEIDLQNIDIFSSDGMIWLAFICQYRKAKNSRTSFVLPTDPNKVDFIQYMGFDVLQHVLDFEFVNSHLLHVSKSRYTRPNKDDPRATLRKITPIKVGGYSQAMSLLSYTIKDFLVATLDVPSIGQESFQKIQPFSITLNELILNIGLHGASTPGSGAGLVAFVLPHKNLKRVRYCFADIGMGFRYTMTPKLERELESDQEAILEGILYRAWNPGSKGLYPCLEYIREKQGALAVRSGDSLVTINLSSPQAQAKFDAGYHTRKSIDWLEEICKTRNVRHLPGAHIYVDLKIDI